MLEDVIMKLVHEFYDDDNYVCSCMPWKKDFASVKEHGKRVQKKVNSMQLGRSIYYLCSGIQM
jgi:hypothetical protein